jgi:hypothetical protein
MARTAALLAASALILSSCGGGGSSGGGTPTPSPTPTPTPTGVFAVPAQESLSVADVETIVARAVAEARARNLPATIAVTDRVGNVLAIFNMTGARATATTSAAPNGDNIDAQNLTIRAAPSPRPLPAPISPAAAMPFPPARRARSCSRISRPHRPPWGWKAARCSACSSASCPAPT